MSDRNSFSRNTTLGFAQRVRKNLHFIETKRLEKEDVHEVTQLAISLLGLIVFPWEAKALEHLEDMPLSRLESYGWPRWEIILDKKDDTDTLGKLTRHLRNAASHRRIKFSSDDYDMKMVEIEFEDAPNKNAPPNWRAKINASDLKLFCDCFLKQLEERVR